MPDYSSWPKAAGFRLPAEWEPHGATWLSWPHNARTWPGALGAVETAMVGVAAALTETEQVRINVLDAAHEQHVWRLLKTVASPSRIAFHHVPTDDAWCRDYGALFPINDRREMIALDFDFNAWGGKYLPCELDAAAAPRMAAALGVRRFAPGMVLEGGSVDVNGAGALLTTEQCLLNPNRNPGLDRAAIEARLKHALGAEQVIWLVGGIEGDDTDGHVDGVARFVSRCRVVAAVEAAADDPNHRALAVNRDRLGDVRLSDGQRLDIVDLPMPDPLTWRGRRLPASYANFYAANGVVLIPQFGGSKDGIAREILGQCFKERRAVCIDCRDIAIGLGAVHCLTQQVPWMRYTPATAAGAAAEAGE